MNILMSGSGSGGHIYPCISTYNYFKEKNNVFIVIFKEIDKKIYDLNNIDYIYIEDSLSIKDKLKKIKKIIINNNINITMTFGGKNSFFINLVAKSLKKKIYIFEQNAIIGKANKFNYILANKMFTNFKINKKKEVNIGNPNTFSLKTKKISLFSNNKITILITLGSLGSSTVDKVIKQLINELDDFNIIYVTGNNVNKHKTDNKNVRIFNYYNNLTELINISDIVISRAGASTLAEIIKLKKPSINIPSPYVTNNHQYINAKVLEDSNACILLKEKDTNLFTLKSKIYSLSTNKLLYDNIVRNLTKLENKGNFNDIERVINNDYCQKS